MLRESELLLPRIQAMGGLRQPKNPVASRTNSVVATSNGCRFVLWTIWAPIFFQLVSTRDERGG
jgi:hypothetical protein